MRLPRSIRWQLQLWHGVLLAVVLSGFGWTAWRLDRDAQLQRVDQELERRVGGIEAAVRRSRAPQPPPREDDPQGQPPPRPDGQRGEPPPPREDDRQGQPPPPREGDRQGPPPPRPDGQRGQPPPRPGEPAPPQTSLAMLGSDGPGYYVAWDAASTELTRSMAAPADVPVPGATDGERAARTRGTLREFIHVVPSGERILVGRDIAEELAASRRFAWLLTGAGAAVFAFGLAIGWWISTRALRPIRTISATASRIARGDLSQRVPPSGTGSELDDLAGVLNDTFGRLQASFERQAQFTADASHELRTPLSVVLTQAQLALSRERTGEEYRDSLDACRRAALRMRNLTDSLLALARLDAGTDAAPRGRCALDAIARDTASLLTPIAEQKGVTLSVHASAAACEGNAEQLGAVVSNLVSNAIHYNRDGGAVTIRTETNGAWAVVRVEDTGIGIAAADLPHVFDRFYRADKSRSAGEGRSGLGLAITKAIVEAHGGSVTAASTPGTGSTFTVRLPHINPREHRG